MKSVTGDEMLGSLAALANPIRLRIVAALTGQQKFVSQLARELRISRPLLYLHLQRLEAAGLVTGHLELSSDGKAMKYFEVMPFEILLNPEAIAQATQTLTDTKTEKAEE
jgi:ArsR family transcriptional regulator